ncbi:PepSY-associated TM helix domain-containing protein, partial [Acinetobacter baumannii]|nr:PepSY-associated TM helix domain-containing protein [Acinetobacter baumannii]
GGWDSGDTLLTANFVVPSLCQLNSTSTVDFGNINDIGTTKTWTGLIFGWLVFAIFLMGSLSYYRHEINLWMQPS